MRGLALLMAVPTVVVAAGLGGLEVWRARRPDAALFSTPFRYSLAEAIAAGDVPRAYAFLRAGQDPNAPIVVRDPVLTRGRDVIVPPLVWAVATRNAGAVHMLMGYGARFDAATRDEAACVAARTGDQGIAELVTYYAGEPGGRCPAVPDAAPVLPVERAPADASGRTDDDGR